jgi:hypothetical protein
VVSDPIGLHQFLPLIAEAVERPSAPSIDPARETSAAPSPQIAALRLDGREMSALVSHPWKLVIDHIEGAEELYNLADDPKEQNNLAYSQAERVERLKQALDAFVGGQAAGWHILACGGSVTSEIEITLDVPVDSIRTRAFEESDTLSATQTAEASRVHLSLVPLAKKKEVDGEPVDVLVADEDEVVLDTDVPVSTKLTLRSVTNEAIPLTIGESDQVIQIEQLNLADHRQAALVRPSAVVDCEFSRLGGVGADVRPEIWEPRVRIWFIPHAASLRDEDVDPLVAERLKALGYMW